MSGYIGRSPEYGNAVSQQITGTNSAGPYTLSYDTSTSGVVISLDGVVQRNSVDFNIVGTALTFTSTVGTGIIINVVFTGLTLSFPTPSDGSVTLAKMAVNSIDSDQYVDGSIDLAHLSADCVDGTKIADDAIDSEHLVNGSVDDAHLATGISSSKLSGALPAVSGASLTSLNASNLGSGTVPTARLGSGTASSSTFLRGDQTYAEAGGIVKKVYAYEYGTRTSASSSANIFSFTTSWTPVNPSTNSFAIACSVPADSLNKDHIGVGLRFARSGGANYDFEGDGTFFSGHINSAVNCGNIFNISAGVLEVGTYTIYLRVFSANSTLSIFLPNSSDDSRLSAGTTAHLTITEYKN